ncbi:MAG: transposase [archaeon]
MIFKAVHAVVNKASIIVAEDLSSLIASKKGYGKNMNRRLSAWTKGVIAEALKNVSQRRGALLALVNPAYTSQVDSRNGCLLGKRKGDSFYCFDGVVLQADENAAQNVLARLHDPEISRWMPYQQVRSILLARTERHRLKLLQPGLQLLVSPDVSTESEVPTEQVCSRK